MLTQANIKDNYVNSSPAYIVQTLLETKKRIKDLVTYGEFDDGDRTILLDRFTVLMELAKSTETGRVLLVVLEIT